MQWIKLFVILFIVNISFGQNSQNVEKLFKTDISKLSFVVQPSFSSGYNVSPNSNPNINFRNSFSPQIGVFYNFAQHRNFNFKAGIIVKHFKSQFDINVSNEDLNAGFDYSNELGQFEMANQLIFSETLKTEYFYSINSKSNFVIGLGVNLDIRSSGGNDELLIDIYDFNTEEYKTLFIANSNEQQVTSSLDLSIGYNRVNKYGLFQFEIFSNSQILSYPKTGSYVINLANNETVQGVYTIKGNFYGVSLIYSPKKGLFKKKK